MTPLPIPRPRDLGLRPDEPLPIGTRVVLDRTTVRWRPDVLFGGSPPHLLRLSGAGVEALGALLERTVGTASAVLGRRLTDNGMAHPVPSQPTGEPDVTVIVPVRDRPTELEGCLEALRGLPVVVVDDGSSDPERIRAVAETAGARLVRRPESGGPGAARNTGLAAVETELVAFVDSDCVVPPGWLGSLVGHFADPLVAAVAPRITADEDRTSPLDRGPDPARVAPRTAVSYVPTATLVVRRALVEGGFDEALRYGEDVDLVWRLFEAGWRVRYEPSVVVRHREPRAAVARIRRSFAYGTSVGPLAARHPGDLVHLVLSPGPALAVAALVARRPASLVVAYAATVALLHRRLRRFAVPLPELVVPAATGIGQTWVGVGRWALQFAWPVLLGLLARPGGATAAQQWGRRLSVLAVIAAPILKDRPVLSDSGIGQGVAAVAGYLSEQAAYGTGALVSCWRARQAAPIVPEVTGLGPLLDQAEAQPAVGEAPARPSRRRR